MFLGISKTSPVTATRGDMGWCSVSVTQKIECFRYIFRFKFVQPNRIINLIHHWSKNKAVSWDKKVFNIYLAIIVILNCTTIGELNAVLNIYGDIFYMMMPFLGTTLCGMIVVIQMATNFVFIGYTKQLPPLNFMFKMLCTETTVVF